MLSLVSLFGGACLMLIRWASLLIDGCVCVVYLGPLLASRPIYIYTSAAASHTDSVSYLLEFIIRHRFLMVFMDPKTHQG